MPGNFLRETPAEYHARIQRDAAVLGQLVYSISGEEPAFDSGMERDFALLVANDFIGSGADRHTTKQYIEALYAVSSTGGVQ